MIRWSRRRALQAGGLLPLLACGDRAPRSASSQGAARVVSQIVLADEVLWDLGPEVRATVVAVSSMADDPRYSRVAGAWPAALPRVAGTSETLLVLAPTLIILASFTAAETRELLERAGLPMLVLERFDGFEDYRANVRAIAGAVSASAAGERVISDFDARLAALRRASSPRPGPPLRAVSWNEGSVPAAGTSFDDIATAAGLANLPAEDGRRGHLQVSVEQLVAWDPDVIVIPCGDLECSEAAAALAARAGLHATRAVRRGAVIGVPSHELYSSGAGMLDVVARLRSADPGSPP